MIDENTVKAPIHSVSAIDTRSRWMDVLHNDIIC